MCRKAKLSCHCRPGENLRNPQSYMLTRTDRQKKKFKILLVRTSLEFSDVLARVLHHEFNVIDVNTYIYII